MKDYPALALGGMLLSLLLLAVSTSCAQMASRPPNVIIILTDDQAWGDLSSKGNTNLSTPNIDALGAAGATFTNFYVQPVCSPTRAELLTGRYSFRTGVYSTGGGGERMNVDETTLGDVFKQAGYQTAAYGKWHNGMQYPYHPNGRGFDDFYGFCSGHWGDYFSPMLERNGAIVQGAGYLVDDFTSHGLDFMEKNRDQPFLLYLPFNTPHTPFQVPERNWKKLKHKTIDSLANRAEDLVQTRAALAMVENIDENVGRILAKIEALGIEHQTIVLFFSDNGPAHHRWNAGLKGKKGSTNEGGVRSPLLMKWPGVIQSGTTVDRLSAVIDLLPTLSELCGIPYSTEQPLDGVSMKQYILNPQAEWADRYILNTWNEQVSIRNQKYRLSHDGALFDIELDREQTTDLSKALPVIREAMLQQAADFSAQKRAALPAVDERPFYLGHPAMRYTQIPARDGLAHGNIRRSNRWPNCSFFTNWNSITDSLTWQVEVPKSGRFRVYLYYTCSEGDQGSTFQLTVGKSKLISQIREAHDPPLRGMELDLSPRVESYVKDWKAVDIGTIELYAGAAELCLKALEIPGNSIMDFRLLLFERLE